MDGLLDSPCFRMVELLKAPGIRKVEFSETPRFSYGWTLSVHPIIVWLNSQRPLVFIW